MSKEVNTIIDHLFRTESGKMVSVLTKFFGLKEIELAEDIVQETLITAFETWKLKGVPENQVAWLYKVAKNKVLNYLKSQKLHENLLEANKFPPQENELEQLFFDAEIEDSQLRMMFACCHPEIPEKEQIILILKILCGLSTKEIASGFLSNEEAIAKQLYRAKEKIKNGQIKLDVPVGNELVSRLDTVLQAIYLLFNEAYKASHEEDILRKDLCFDALSLCKILAEVTFQNVELEKSNINALMALMCFHIARFDGRIDEKGEIVLLENQNRKLWNRFLISKGYDYLKLSRTQNSPSKYHLEAGIASYHASSPSFLETNWQAIYYCYSLLYELNPSDTVALNKAIALGYAESPKRAIEALLEIKTLNKSAFYHTALGDFYFKNQDLQKARESYIIALKYIVLKSEKKVIENKLDDIDSKISG
jgi:RNA polymerase sigma factor (sigma-70 family)